MKKKLTCALAGCLAAVTLAEVAALVASAQCDWRRRLILPLATSGQPGLAVFGRGRASRLFLAFVAAGEDHEVVIEASPDGRTFTLAAKPEGFNANFGVGLASSRGCNALLAAFAGMRVGSPLELATSTDGYHWSRPVAVGSNVESTPAVVQRSTPEGSGWMVAYLVDDPYVYPEPIVATRAISCDLRSISDEKYCFFNRGTCETFSSTGTPGWASANQQWLRAVAGPEGGPILQSNPRDKAVPPNHTSNTGVSAAIDPGTGTGYLAWAESVDNYISLFDTSSGDIRTCGVYTFSAPALAFFRGLMWVAWRGGANDRVNVGAIMPFGATITHAKLPLRQ